MNRAESAALPDALDIGYPYSQIFDQKMIRSDAEKRASIAGIIDIDVLGGYLMR